MHKTQPGSNLAARFDRHPPGPPLTGQPRHRDGAERVGYYQRIVGGVVGKQVADDQVRRGCTRNIADVVERDAVGLPLIVERRRSERGGLETGLPSDIESFGLGLGGQRWCVPAERLEDGGLKDTIAGGGLCSQEGVSAGSEVVQVRIACLAMLIRILLAVALSVFISDSVTVNKYAASERP